MIEYIIMTHEPSKPTPKEPAPLSQLTPEVRVALGEAGLERIDQSAAELARVEMEVADPDEQEKAFDKIMQEIAESEHFSEDVRESAFGLLAATLNWYRENPNQLIEVLGQKETQARQKTDGGDADELARVNPNWFHGTHEEAGIGPISLPLATPTIETKEGDDEPDGAQNNSRARVYDEEFARRHNQRSTEGRARREKALTDEALRTALGEAASLRAALSVERQRAKLAEEEADRLARASDVLEERLASLTANSSSDRQNLPTRLDVSQGPAINSSPANMPAAEEMIDVHSYKGNRIVGTMPLSEALRGGLIAKHEPNSTRVLYVYEPRACYKDRLKSQKKLTRAIRRSGAVTARDPMERIRDWAARSESEKAAKEARAREKAAQNAAKAQVKIEKRNARAQAKADKSLAKQRNKAQKLRAKAAKKAARRPQP